MENDSGLHIRACASVDLDASDGVPLERVARGDDLRVAGVLSLKTAQERQVLGIRVVCCEPGRVDRGRSSVQQNLARRLLLGRNGSTQVLVHHLDAFDPGNLLVERLQLVRRHDNVGESSSLVRGLPGVQLQLVHNLGDLGRVKADGHTEDLVPIVGDRPGLRVGAGDGQREGREKECEMLHLGPYVFPCGLDSDLRCRDAG